MNEHVTWRRDGGIAVITVDNPPVNALKHAVRAGMHDCFAAARDDSAVEAIVLTGAGRTFMAGADITEFGKTSQPPSLIDVIRAVDEIKKPTIAAVHGTPLGGGLELTLACHFRVAAPGTRLGLPEIKLGLIPGAGGTQRLPRLVGIDKALGMILSGDPIPAKDALAVGLIDEIIEGDLVAGAVAFARRVVAEKRPLRRVRDLEDELAEVRSHPEKFGEIVAAHAKRSRGLAAPAAAIEAVRWTLDVPIDEALRREREKFMELLAGDQSKAQRHIFFAEREAAKIPGVAKDVVPHEIKRAAVIGAGTMGGGISMCFANAGIPVTVIETSAEALKRGQDTIARNYKTSVSRGSLAADEMERRLARFTGTTDIGAVADADIVIEAVFETMDIKKQVFGNLDRLAKPGAVLASNTSYLDINAIAQTTQRPASVLGTHFFSPANVMKLLEIVRGKETAPDVLATAIAVGRKLGKVPVVVGVCHGFVGNRMLSARGIEAERLLLEGALPQQVDGALTEFGFPMGPFAMSDLAGLDVSWRNRKDRGVTAVIADAICEKGDFGQKTGKGYYVYEAGARAGRPNPEVEALVVDTSRRLGIARREIGKEEIIERLIYPMINEGARILEEGIALRPGDIDVIWIYGYGFPVWRGGPMYYADAVGLRKVRDRLAELAKATGDKRHTPAALLERLAKEGATFGSLASGKG
ncbi:MAG TPA: 3-hydroxyacyl-CoA dehydrogenase NAD-binding domain-containing protein [Xanthobacteraceae bacterium]|nr:3-hydroxyacyl-CoA dehydrogenase NAD-binding domain-containing protein [Xanthobacteraceae bacterium]